MSKTNGAILNFFKRNAYYLIISFALLVTAVVIIAVLAGKNSSLAELPKSDVVIDEPSKESESPDIKEPKSDDKTDDSTETDSGKDVEPTGSKIVFTTPVSSATVVKGFTSATVVYNKTLGVYTGHMGIDFSAEAGAPVVAAYSGTVESVTSSYLEGTTVTIDHGNGLKTVYNSIEADENLATGKTVSAGQVIGVVSDNNKQEYKDGPHLHFETILNGLKIDPETYLMTAEK